MSEINNPCCRCGKQRVVVSVKKERVGCSLVTTTTTTCPDCECQKLLDKQLKKDKDTREMLTGVVGKPVNSFNRQKKNIVLEKK